MKKNFGVQLLSLLIGLALFLIVIKLAGLENIIGSIRNFSPIYIGLFVLMAIITTHLAAALRWKYILVSEGVDIPVWTLLKYKVTIFGLNYLTPVARIGGEPFKILLLKRQRVKSSKSFASVVVDNFLGMGIDVLIAGFALIAVVFSAATISGRLKSIFLLGGVLLPLAVAVVYASLRKKKGIFSSLFSAIGSLTRTGNTKPFLEFCRGVARSEFYMRMLLTKRPRSMLFALFFAALSWPLTIMQYKFALLALGFDASLIQIVISMIVINITLLIPIPAALGIQEAGQFSAFQLFSANPYIGIALSLMLRFKDTVLLLVSFLFLAREGAGIFGLVGNRISSFAKKALGR